MTSWVQRTQPRGRAAVRRSQECLKATTHSIEKYLHPTNVKNPSPVNTPPTQDMQPTNNIPTWIRPIKHAKNNLRPQ